MSNDSEPLAPRLWRWLSTRDVRRKMLLLALWSMMLATVIAFHQVLLPFVGALLLAYVIEPVVRLLTKIKIANVSMPRWASVVIIYLAFFGVLTAAARVGVPRLAHEVQRITEKSYDLLAYLDTEHVEQFVIRVEEWLGTTSPGGSMYEVRPSTELTAPPSPHIAKPIDTKPSDSARRTAASNLDVGEIIRDTAARLRSGIKEALAQTMGRARQWAVVVADTLFGFLLLLMLTAFISMDATRIKGFFMGLVPMGYEGDAHHLLSRINAGLSGVVRGQLTIMLINGALTFLGLLLLQVKYAVFLAFVATVLYVVPIFGTILSSVPIVLVAFGDGTSKAVGILLWILGIHAVEAYYLNPKILGEAAHIHPVLIVFALVAGQHVGGAIGVLLAVPAMSVVVVVFKFMHRRAAELLTAADSSL